MRTKNDLFLLGDLSILLQYLYMDENHTITFNNGITDLKIRMDEDFNILCRNMNFPDLPETYFSSEMIPANCLGVIQILKETPPEEYTNSFNNRWDEIEKITKSNLALNRK